MAIEYSMDLGEPMTADDVGRVFSRTAAAHRILDGDHPFDRDGAVLSSRQWVSVYPPGPSAFPGPHPIEEQFGFAPAVIVVFRWQNEADFMHQRKDMIRLVAAVLEALPGDAWLAFAGEITKLVRLDGKLTITTDDAFWVPEVLELLPAHDRADLPNL